MTSRCLRGCIYLKKYQCPCCECFTYNVPPKEDCGYICPVCFWENDPFITSDSDPSDLNHGITLNEAKNNYLECSITLSKPFIPVYLFLILCPPCSKLSVNCFWKGNQIAIHTFPTIFQGLYMMNLNWSCYNAIN